MIHEQNTAYHRAEQQERAWRERMIATVAGSNSLANLTGIDYSHHRPTRSNHGHFGALLQAEQYGRDKRPLDAHDLVNWQQRLAQEYQACGNQLSEASIAPDQIVAQIQPYINDLNHQLSLNGEYARQSKGVALMGDIYYRLHALQPFGEVTDPVCRLVVNYVATRIGLPVIVWRPEEQQALSTATSSANGLRCFFAHKIQEAVYMQGELCTRTEDYGLSATYKSVSSNKQVVVEWHDLVRAIHQWEQGEQLA